MSSILETLKAADAAIRKQRPPSDYWRPSLGGLYGKELGVSRN